MAARRAGIRLVSRAGGDEPPFPTCEGSGGESKPLDLCLREWTRGDPVATARGTEGAPSTVSRAFPSHKQIKSFFRGSSPPSYREVKKLMTQYAKAQSKVQNSGWNRQQA
jgi:hypothetical protein